MNSLMGNLAHIGIKFKKIKQPKYNHKITKKDHVNILARISANLEIIVGIVISLLTLANNI